MTIQNRIENKIFIENLEFYQQKVFFFYFCKVAVDFIQNNNCAYCDFSSSKWKKLLSEFEIHQP